MFHTQPLLMAIQADRRREFERVARQRQLLGHGQPPASKTARASSAIGTSSTSIGARRTRTSGPACEAP
jgi:hypothetical protein